MSHVRQPRGPAAAIWMRAITQTAARAHAERPHRRSRLVSKETDGQQFRDEQGDACRRQEAPHRVRGLAGGSHRHDPNGR